MQKQPKGIQGQGRPLVRRIYHCQCGYPIFFRNHLCLHCGRALGYEPDSATILSLDPVRNNANAIVGWRKAQAPQSDGVYLRCANFSLAPQCNWLVPKADSERNPLCRCCRLNRTIPDQSIAANASLWHTVELMKRRLVSSLIALGLPVASRLNEDTRRGLAFDLLAQAAAPQPVTTGHHNGVITLNIDEADDAARESIRTALHEPYRTVLGHLRHESGHYYWSRLLDGSPWHDRFRALFGDERQDYAAALQKHYSEGPPPNWATNCVSAYASAHPWEDWAETWAHYLHMVDALDTAMGFGMGNNHLCLLKDPFSWDVLYRADGENEDADQEFLVFVNTWAGLTSVLNEFSLGMGLADFYPFVLSKQAVTKLHFVHRFIKTTGQASIPTETQGAVNERSPDIA